MRDYVAWHDQYDDPDSELSWRLRTVQGYLEAALDAALADATASVRLLSACAGDARDVVQVLAPREDAARVATTLIEVHPGIAARAARAAAAAGLRVDLRVTDAGTTDAYAGAVPADVVLLVGIFGNLSDADRQRTIRTAPQFCRPGATLLWSRGRDAGDLNSTVRAELTAAGFTELGYAAHPASDGPAVGAVRYDGPPRDLVAGQPLFSFRR